MECGYYNCLDCWINYKFYKPGDYFNQRNYFFLLIWIFKYLTRTKSKFTIVSQHMKTWFKRYLIDFQYYKI